MQRPVEHALCLSAASPLAELVFSESEGPQNVPKLASLLRIEGR
jgi:hypothetical protein